MIIHKTLPSRSNRYLTEWPRLLAGLTQPGFLTFAEQVRPNAAQREKAAHAALAVFTEVEDDSRVFDHATANPANRGEYDALILNRVGRVCGFEVAAETLFGARQRRLMKGRRISDFVVGIILEGSSPDDDARQLHRLCADNNWQQFEAIDSHGISFAVEIRLSRRMTDGQDAFVLDFRGQGYVPPG